MTYDCFTFFNELDLLEIRLNVLKDVVDRFVLVEADRTFTNRPKPLVFEENKARFAEFSDRIIHVVVKDHPPFKTACYDRAEYEKRMAQLEEFLCRVFNQSPADARRRNVYGYQADQCRRLTPVLRAYEAARNAAWIGWNLLHGKTGR